MLRGLEMKKYLKSIAYVAAMLLIGFVIFQLVIVISPTTNIFANQ